MAEGEAAAVEKEGTYVSRREWMDKAVQAHYRYRNALGKRILEIKKGC